MEFFKLKRAIPFMSYGKWTTSISLITFLLAIFFLFTKGLNFGIDFTGGTVVEVHYTHSVNLDDVRKQLADEGMHDAVVQNFGTSQDVLIQVPLKHEVDGAKLSEHVMQTLKKHDATVEKRRVEFVGPQVGQELVENGAMALLLVSLGIVIYLWVRFEWKFGLAAIIANLHDVVIILGVFALFQWEFSLPVLAAVLAVLGYSVNESVVVFDRIRENFRSMRGAPVTEIIDDAITATMSRTIITHLSTQMVVCAMLFFGGPVLHGFAMALTIGICFSIYSSVLVASPLLLLFGVSREDFIKPEKSETDEVLP